MIVQRSERFRRAYKKLTEAQRQRVDNALLRVLSDPRHPSLRVKRLQGMARIWSARASDELRFTFELTEDRVALRNVHQDATLRSP